MNPSKNFLVCFYSDPNFLSLNILEQLLSNGCYVNIVSNEKERWEELTSHINSKNKFSVVNSTSSLKNVSFNYVLACFGFSGVNGIERDVSKFSSFLLGQNTKTFVIFPRELYGMLRFEDTDLGSDIGIIYTGDLIGPRINTGVDLRLTRYLYSIFYDKKFCPKVGETFFPLFVSDAARQIVKWLFAFGPFGKEICLQGKEISSVELWQISEKILGPIKYVSISEKINQKNPRNVPIQTVEKNLNYSLSETYKWISYQPPEKLGRKKSGLVFKDKINPIKIDVKKTKVWTISILSVFLLPIFLLIFNVAFLFGSYKLIKSGNFGVATTFLGINKTLSQVSYLESKTLKYIPLVGQLYKETECASFVAKELSDVGIYAIPLVNKSGNLVKNILGENPYLIRDTLGDSEERLQNIHKEILSTEEKIISLKSHGSVLASFIMSKVDFNMYKNLFLQGSVIVKNLPNILGDNENKTYLILFQNNMELRPTGGFIGSYGLLTFDKARLSDFAVNDVYSADGQLNGHVEPPSPIKNYLGEANWWFRDSNWDPDFPTSAKRAEWFLEKEMDQKVDGVISLDLNPVKDFLGIVGQISLSDFNLNITKDNLYEKVQSEVQDNFFPGTYKKGSFLTALAKSLVDNMSNLPSNSTHPFISLMYKNLNSKHVQIYLHDTNSQEAISELNWDGKVYVPSCGNECLADLTGIIEANVGINKSNYFIKRSVSYDIEIGDSIVKTLTLALENNANADMGVSGRYKSYIRLLTGENATNISAEGVLGQSTQSYPLETSNVKGRKETGIIVEVLPGETRKVIFRWTEGSLGGIKNYYAYFRKQSGVEDYPLSVQVSSRVKMLNTNPIFSLTEPKTKEALQVWYKYWYNTTLSKDMFFRLSL